MFLYIYKAKEEAKEMEDGKRADVKVPNQSFKYTVPDVFSMIESNNDKESIAISHGEIVSDIFFLFK